VYLSFFGYPEDDLEALRKIKKLIKDGIIKLFITDQVLEKVARRREDVIACATYGNAANKPEGLNRAGGSF
jgi:hypothetical protein